MAMTEFSGRIKHASGFVGTRGRYVLHILAILLGAGGIFCRFMQRAQNWEDIFIASAMTFCFVLAMPLSYLVALRKVFLSSQMQAATSESESLGHTS